LRPDRLWRRIGQGHKANIKFQDFLSLLEAFGFAYDGTHGSHVGYRHSRTDVRIVLQPDANGDAKVYQVNEFLDHVAGHSLTME